MKLPATGLAVRSVQRQTVRGCGGSPAKQLAMSRIFRVWGIRVEGLGFRVRGLGFRV